MAVAARKAAKPKADEPDLLAGLQEDAPAAVDDTESFDLLEGLTEDSGTPWRPDDEDDPSPEGIQGRVTFIGEVSSDFGPEVCPLIEVETADGMTWSIRGYSTVLRNQLEKAEPRVGDLIALRYFGVKAGKAGREYKNYKVAIRHA